ncbi:MAG: NAD-dependent epimerase/dehydratase family protein [Desulfobacterota bacterium]|nr:NAD-dependent epimerase/dehydratase family protein [Thermodesulfobacteriota bacterium]
MKIILTGGAGFIGSHVADLLLSKGYTVAIIDDLSSGKKENVPEGAILYHMSITDKRIQDVFEQEKPDVVIHHAAQISVSASVKDPLFDLDINIRGTVHLLQTAVHFKVRKFIFASTGGAIYGEHEYFPADERHPLRPLSPYGVSKLAAEKYLYFFYTTHGLNYTVLRYSNVYGPRQDPFGEAGVVAIFTQKMLHGEQPIINGSGEQTRDFVYVGDVAAANLRALETDCIGEFNISTGIETSVNQLFHLLKKITASPAPEVHGPALPGEQLRSVLSWKLAEQRLGWRPMVSLQDGLQATVDFFKTVH